MTISERFNRLSNLLSSAGLDSLALNPGPTFTYLTGLDFPVMERPTVLIFSPGQPLIFVLPGFEDRKLEGFPLPFQSFPFGENPADWPAAFEKACQAARLGGLRLGVEPLRLRFLELRLLEAAAPYARLLSAEHAVTLLRIQKDASELSLMRRAVQISQQAFLNTLPFIHAGVSEAEIAAEINLQMMRAGADPEPAFSTMVVSGENAGKGHARPTSRRLQPGDLLIIDWGACYGGYASDLTRTLGVGQVSGEFLHIARVAAQANAAGRAAARPGVRAGDVDRAARAVIEQAGYGQHFRHRTGHGIGLEVHEAPYLHAENDLILQPGMCFTVEPGISIPGIASARVEDDMVITENSAESLSDLPAEVYVV